MALSHFGRCSSLNTYLQDMKRQSLLKKEIKGEIKGEDLHTASPVTREEIQTCIYEYN